MSLTDHLSDRTSPVWRWLDRRLGASQALARDNNRELRGGPPGTPLALPAGPRDDTPLLGTAVGYVLAAVCQPARLALGVAWRGADRADRLRKKTALDPESASNAVGQAIAALRDLDSKVASTKAEWERACLPAVVLARFEQLYRAGPDAVWAVPPRPAQNLGRTRPRRLRPAARLGGELRGAQPLRARVDPRLGFRNVGRKTSFARR